MQFFERWTFAIVLYENKNNINKTRSPNKCKPIQLTNNKRPNIYGNDATQQIEKTTKYRKSQSFSSFVPIEGTSDPWSSAGISSWSSTGIIEWPPVRCDCLSWILERSNYRTPYFYCHPRKNSISEPNHCRWFVSEIDNVSNNQTGFAIIRRMA